MLVARVSTRNVSRFARSFATVVDTAGVKVAAVDYGQPTSAVTFLIKAGSRFESKPGVAHALKNFAFKSTSARSALGTVRESELYGGVLSTSLSREHLALTAEFLRGDEAFFVELLTSFITSAKFARHEFQEYVVPVIESEFNVASSDPATRALEFAHALAFRSGLGSSLFANPHHAVTVEDIKSFAASAFSKSNVAVLGTGIDQATLSKLVDKTLSSAPSTAALSSSPSTYFGGETRLESDGLQTVFIGYGIAGPSEPAIAALSAYLSPTPSIKWSKGLSPLSELPLGTSIQSIYLPYSDATLFGLLVQGTTAAGVKEAGKLAAKALKQAGGVKADDLKKALTKAKFVAASSIDSRDGIINALGPKVFAGSDASLESILTAFDKVNGAAFTKVTSALFKGKPTYVAIGDIQTLPYVDELGL